MKNIKRLCFIIGIAICSLPAFSQNSTQFIIKDSTSIKQVTVIAEHKRVEKMPEFPGGNADLLKFISENLLYPAEAKDLGLEGVVIVKFIVDVTGKTINPEIVRGVHPLLDNAAMDLIYKLPNFIPGEQAGKKVSVINHLPIQFIIAK